MEADSHFGVIGFEGSSKKEDTFNKNVKVYEKENLFDKKKVKEIVRLISMFISVFISSVAITVLKELNASFWVGVLIISIIYFLELIVLAECRRG